MASKADTEFRYNRLTWDEMNDAIWLAKADYLTDRIPTCIDIQFNP